MVGAKRPAVQGPCPQQQSEAGGMLRRVCSGDEALPWGPWGQWRTATLRRHGGTRPGNTQLRTGGKAEAWISLQTPSTALEAEKSQIEGKSTQ